MIPAPPETRAKATCNTQEIILSDLIEKLTHKYFQRGIRFLRFLQSASQDTLLNSPSVTLIAVEFERLRRAVGPRLVIVKARLHPELVRHFWIVPHVLNTCW